MDGSNEVFADEETAGAEGWASTNPSPWIWPIFWINGGRDRCPLKHFPFSLKLLAPRCKFSISSRVVQKLIQLSVVCWSQLND